MVIKTKAAKEGSGKVKVELLGAETYVTVKDKKMYRAGRVYTVTQAESEELFSYADERGIPYFHMYNPNRAKERAAKEKAKRQEDGYTDNADQDDDGEIDTGTTTLPKGMRTGRRGRGVAV